MIDPRSLRAIEAFSDLSDGDLRWLAEVARPIELQAGDALAEEGQEIDDLFAILEGEIHFVRESGPPDDRWIVRGSGQIAGNLPLSRMVRSPVALRALVPTRVAAFSSARVAEMLDRMPVMHSRLAAVMLDRSREFARLDEQSERLQSLGKLSAGLAHELNNPAAAIQRRIEELGERLAELGELVRDGLGPALPADRLAELVRLTTTAATPDARERVDRDPLARSDAQDRLQTWLEAREVPDAWRVAETLVAHGLPADRLDDATEGLPSEATRSLLRWMAAELAARSLLDDLADASGRIVELIATVKAYANLDRAPAKEAVDVNEGVHSTLTMLAHKLRAKDLVLTRDLAVDPPRVLAHAGELNQVWTNLIDNAIDAAPEGSTITVRSARTPDGLSVHVVDEGPGMPPEVQRHIFEPFFTTKEIGEGTGIGLDIARRIVRAHGGEIRVESEPGRTCFAVRLPAGTEPRS